MSDRMKVPGWYWVLAIVMLIWNLMGVGAFFADYALTHTPGLLDALPEDQRILYETRAAWYIPAFAIGIFAGTLGCIALLIRRKWAVPLFIISFIGVIAQNIHTWFIHDSYAVVGAFPLFISICVILICVFLIWFSRFAASKDWLK